MDGPTHERGGGRAARPSGPPRVEIYTWRHCPYCLRAKALLEALGVPYRELAIDGDPEARRRMAERAGGRRTLPQIFVDGRPIGGCAELEALHRSGRLRTLLAGPPPAASPGGEP